MKRLYSFEHDFVKTKKVPEKQGDKEVLVEKKETSTRKFFLRKPSRTMLDDSEFYQKKEYNKCVKAGILTAAQVSRDITNDGGVFSEDQKKQIEKATEELKSLVEEKKEIEEKEKQSKKDKERLSELMKEIESKVDVVEEVQMVSNRLFDHTAESYARNRLINWWLVHLLYEEKDDSFEPFFGKGDEDSKFDQYDEYEDSDDPDESEFFESLTKRAVNLVVFWYMSDNPTEETFKQIDPVLRDEQKDSRS
jgi:vacuolar-type H+-ATPase subunit I/STV1